MSPFGPAPRPDPAARRYPFDYAVIRLVPRVDRGERVNAGVVLHCQALDFLAARVGLDENRLLVLDPTVDVGAVRLGLAAWSAQCAGGDAAGPAGRDSPGRRFRWLTAPRSTVIQPGPVHRGLTADPVAELDRLFGVLVL